jgi:hypothetical protein
MTCGATSVAHAAFDATPTRTVGPFVSGQVSPAPGGGWTAGDDRTLGKGINGQEGWTEFAFNTKYDNEITTASARTGSQAWRVSNWFHTGLVQAFMSPTVAAAGETGSLGSTGNSPVSNNMSVEFYFRTVNTTPDTGFILSTSLSGADRMTYFDIWDDGSTVTTSSIDFLTGGGTTNPVSPALTRGDWYRVLIEATFNDGTANDVVRYRLFDSSNAVITDDTMGSWEEPYFEGLFSAPGTLRAVDHISFRVSANPDTNDFGQAPSDTFSVTNRPFGVYIDDLTISNSNGILYSTSFEAAVVPEPATLGLAAVGAWTVLGGRRRRGR